MMYSGENLGKKILSLGSLKYSFLITPFVSSGCSGPAESSTFVPKLHMRRSGGRWIHQCFVPAGTFLSLLPPVVPSSSSSSAVRVSWQCHFPSDPYLAPGCRACGARSCLAAEQQHIPRAEPQECALGELRLGNTTRP